MWLYKPCDLDPEDSNMFFAQDTLGYDDNIQSLVTKGSEHIIQTSTEILNVCCDLEQSNIFTGHFGLSIWWYAINVSLFAKY